MADLTDEQRGALAFLRAFIDGPARMACLCGYAGVGKTYLIGRWLQELDGLAVCVATPTHQALKVLREKYAGGGIEFYTLSALLGEEHDVDPETGGDDFAPTKTRRDVGMALVGVDECSMVNADTFARLCLSPAKVLFVGDPAQLPPVGERESRTFSVEPKFMMTNIVRQAADNPIIGVSMMIRARMANPGYVILPDMRAALTDDPRYTIVEWDQVYPWAVDAYERGLRAPILAFKNETVDGHNAVMHKLLHPEAPMFAAGEPLLSYETRYDGGEPVLYNGEIVKCVSCERSHWDSLVGGDVYMVELERDSGRRLWVRVADPAALKRAMDANMARIRRLAPYRFRSAEDQTAYDEAMAVNRNLREFVRLKHAYSCTVHKSQGSTYDVAFVDFTNVAGAPDMKMRARLHYVAATRAASYLVLGHRTR